MKNKSIRISIYLVICALLLQSSPVTALSNDAFIPDRESLRETRYHQEGVIEPTAARVFIAPTIEQLAQTQIDVESFDCSTPDIGIPPEECEALVALYSSTNGAGWAVSTNWLSSTPAGQWYGISVAGENVTDVDLANNLLSGEIPASLSSLTNLVGLHLYHNQLSGLVPPELGYLSSLQYLELGHNQLTGTIPIELGELSALKNLHLLDNQLTGEIPEELGSLSALRDLGLESNQLIGTVPDSIWGLTNLIMLGLYDNNLVGTLPVNFNQLMNLQYLLLSGNNLSGAIPTGLGSLTNLYYLDLSNNAFSGDVPASFTNLVNLCEAANQTVPCDGTDGLDLGFNQLNISVPEPLASFLLLKDPDWYLTQEVSDPDPDPDPKPDPIFFYLPMIVR